MRALAHKLCAVVLLGVALPALSAARPAGADRLEPGKQGETIEGEARVLPQPYSKGVREIGEVSPGGRTGNLTMTWSGSCAYIADGLSLGANGDLAKIPHGPSSGVAVIDVRNPSQPKVARYLQDKGAIDATETLHAVTTAKRKVLAASTYGGVAGVNGPKEGWLDIYDLSNCRKPKLMAEVKWPEPVHTLTISPDGNRVYGTVISPFTGNGGIQVMDISDMSHPRFLAKFAATRPGGTSFEFAPHELSISPDEKRLYVGTIASKGGDLNPGVKLFPPNAEGLGPEAGGIYIFDNSDLADGKTDPKLRLIGTSLHGGWHSAVQARIGGKRFLVGAGELGACPGAWPRISDISDETKPRVISHFRLAMNLKENCPSRTPMEAATGGVLGRAGIAAAHFNDVDDAGNTRLGLFPMMYAGLRIVDLSTPTNPIEVAYFKPGDSCMSHVRYVKQTGHIWFACNESGFFVIELKAELRRALKLPPAGKQAARR